MCFEVVQCYSRFYHVFQEFHGLARFNYVFLGSLRFFRVFKFSFNVFKVFQGFQGFPDSSRFSTKLLLRDSALPKLIFVLPWPICPLLRLIWSRGRPVRLSATSNQQPTIFAAPSAETLPDTS